MLISMADHRERPGLGRSSRLTAGAIAVAVTACLGAAGCSAVKSAASAQASPSEIPSHDTLTGPPADPYAGTPADQWANGAAGIVLPAARPIGGFTTAQVESAHQTTRKLLIAADLDKTTLLGGAPTAFADLLTNSSGLPLHLRSRTAAPSGGLDAPRQRGGVGRVLRGLAGGSNAV